MAEKPVTGKQRRLSPERILDGAMALADEIGIETFTIRKLADALGTKPMTIYHHIPNKDAIIDGMIERVFAEIERPPADLEWREAIRHRCNSARAAMVRHPWAAPLMDSRPNPGPETYGHHDAVLGCLLDAGFSMELIAHAYALIDSYIYGFALQENALPVSGAAELQEVVSSMSAQLEPYPNLARFTVDHLLQPDYDFTAEFDFGLDLILDGLARAADLSARRPAR